MSPNLESVTKIIRLAESAPIIPRTDFVDFLRESSQRVIKITRNGYGDCTSFPHSSYPLILEALLCHTDDGSISLGSIKEITNMVIIPRTSVIAELSANSQRSFMVTIHGRDDIVIFPYSNYNLIYNGLWMLRDQIQGNR